MSFDAARLRAELCRLPEASGFLIAYSGGLDSGVLLHALCSLRAAGEPIPDFAAIHVHHGLEAQADAWLKHCRAQCEAWDVSLQAIEVDARAAVGESPEARAREARYAAFASVLGEDAALLTAHHADDQAETVLLQLLRGSGPSGLAAMAPVRPFGRGWHGRPLLPFTRAELAAYAYRHELVWVDDPSNLRLQADRNFLRARVLPVLRERWPALASTLGRAALHQGEAAVALEVLAAQDRMACAGSEPHTLSVAAMGTLPSARQRQVLRAWIAEAGLATPQAVHVEQILQALLPSAVDRVPLVRWPGAEVRRFRGALYCMRLLRLPHPGVELFWDGRSVLELPQWDLELRPEALQRLGYTGEPAGFTVRFRQGGETCCPVDTGHSRSLKNLFQEAAVPPWERRRTPLLYEGGRLVCVYGYWLCAGARSET